ncbi:MAG: D-alanyl-D-alanine carboxypeptidase/D-alanyl-D-alanine-endopeptidase [Actinobacteria bacterium]|nr:D-alanyl-D-alanine carboxypeptidase/D-alanyl-D-alanine-endopeptidase [Actinomycetota bacterium]MBW3651858.1 D-alanyl-D-alanine carboxypeptidase/D-alanyl-D-alanine-endopeptidase [Actinomycetota bacterium]
MRRSVVPALLTLTMVSSSGAMALSSAVGPAPEVVEPHDRLRPATPVLSARRVPGLLSRTVGLSRLHADLDALFENPSLGGARQSSCLSVEEGDTSIYERRADQRLIPASTLKVLTGMAALRRLGPEFRFVTHLRARAVKDGVVEGPLWLVGAGDPLLATQAYADSFRNQPQVFTSLDALADAVVAAGVREIRGGIHGDESRYDTVRYVPSWKPVYISENESGPVSALVVNDNFVQYRPLKTIPTDAPALHGAATLTNLLRGRGMVVGEPGQSTAPAEAKPVASVASSPLPEIVGQMLRESDNLTAEMLTKELGRRFGAGGSWDEGVKVIRATVAEAGLPAEGYVAVDGSGLDVSDRLSCSVLMDALDLAGPEGPVAEGLALAGQTGTLATRFKGNPAEGRLRAKTGSLNFVAGLVGFVDAQQSRKLEFALLANDLPDKIATGRMLQEQVGAVLSQYPKAPPPEALRPERPRPAG